VFYQVIDDLVAQAAHFFRWKLQIAALFLVAQSIFLAGNAFLGWTEREPLLTFVDRVMGIPSLPWLVGSLEKEDTALWHLARASS
jgi:hypothetical protein